MHLCLREFIEVQLQNLRPKRLKLLYVTRVLSQCGQIIVFFSLLSLTLCFLMPEHSCLTLCLASRFGLRLCCFILHYLTLCHCSLGRAGGLLVLISRTHTARRRDLPCVFASRSGRRRGRSRGGSWAVSWSSGYRYSFGSLLRLRWNNRSARIITSYRLCRVRRVSNRVRQSSSPSFVILLNP